MSEEKNAYILGTERAELHRLGVQHQVWSAEARKGWELAEFSSGQRILDLGCGPGFCTTELAYLVGAEGEVIGIDRSEGYIRFLQQLIDLHGLNIKALAKDFNQMDLPRDHLDGAYCRWALAWLPNPEEIMEKIKKALRPGGAFVVQEYYDWSTFQTEPTFPGLQKGIAAALQSFFDAPGEINIGRRLATIFADLGMEVISIRPMSKLATPDELTWQWPKTFLNIYLPKLVAQNYLTEEEVTQALTDWDNLEWMDGVTCLCPQMVEVIAVKV